MKSSEKKWKPDVDSAWQNFYVRACADSLVPVEEEWILEEDKMEPPIEVMFKRKRFPTYLQWSVAALLAVCCICITMLFWYRSLPNELIALRHPNDQEVLVTNLPDGSTLFLSGGSEITYPRSFPAHQRRVTLKGEAFFDVTHDPKRPFIVETEYAAVEVMGTSFRIRSDQERLFELAVRTGVVRVALKKEEHEVLVEAGEQVQLMANWLQKGYIEDLDLIDRLPRRFYFKEETLGRIIDVVNEVSSDSTRLVLEDASLSALTITVTLDFGSIERTADLLCDAFGLVVNKRDDVIYIGKK